MSVGIGLVSKAVSVASCPPVIAANPGQRVTKFRPRRFREVTERGAATPLESSSRSGDQREAASPAELAPRPCNGD